MHIPTLQHVFLIEHINIYCDIYKYDKIFKKNCRAGACKIICTYIFTTRNSSIIYVPIGTYIYYYIGRALIFNTLLTFTM